MRAFKFTNNIPISKTLFFIFVLSFGLACGKSSAENETQQAAAAQAETVINITVDKAVSREVPAVIQSTGSVTADETSDIASKVGGRVTNIYANVGQYVAQGSVIAKLDENEARLGLSPNGTFNSSTIPEVRSANASIEQAQAQLREAEANLRQAEANEKRYRELVETGDVAVVTYETYRTARDTARAARDTARANVNSARQQLEAAINAAKQNNEAIKAAQAAVEASRTQVGIAEQAVADTVIRAPFSGYLSARPTAVGEFVTTSTPIATILRTNPIRVQMQIAEADIPFVTLGRAVQVQVESYKDRTFGGTVTAVNPAIDQTSRSAIVEAQIENNDNALRAGMFATARIVREGGSTGVFVPRSAVQNDKATQNYRVYVIQENVAKLRTVQIGIEENDFYQILSGVNPDETVATSNLEQLFEGAKVAF